MPLLYAALGLIVVGIIISLIWRRDALPCPSWLAWMVEMDNPFTKVNRASAIVELLELAPGMKVLDAGCGPGRLTTLLAAAVGPHGEVTALDIQEEMLARVRAKMQAANLHNVRFVHAGLGNGQLPKEYFDRVVMVTVLGEIPDQTAALQEIHAALQPGAVLSVTEVIFDPHFQPREAVLHAAQMAGFEEKNFLGRKLAYTMHLEKKDEP